MFRKDNQKQIELLGQKINVKYELEGYYCGDQQTRKVYKLIQKGIKEGVFLDEKKRVIGSWSLSDKLKK